MIKASDVFPMSEGTYKGENKEGKKRIPAARLEIGKCLGERR